MQYFTKEMWAGLQEDPPTRDWVSEWVNNGRKYYRQLDQLRRRVDATTFRFFTKETLHDGVMVTLAVLDERGAQPRRRSRAYSRRDPMVVTIEAAASTPDKPRSYILRYQNVRRLVVDHPSEQVMFRSDFEGFGYWGYDELTSAGRDYLRHQILFSSGATILIECKRVIVRKGKTE